jgi:hypothetical protein
MSLFDSLGNFVVDKFDKIMDTGADLYKAYVGAGSQNAVLNAVPVEQNTGATPEPIVTGTVQANIPATSFTLSPLMIIGIGIFAGAIAYKFLR